MSDDAQWIEQALDGCTDAFGQLVLKYQDRLYNTLFHVLGHAEDARDVTQEAFVQAFMKLGSFQRQSEFYTWLYRIAFNTAMSSRRRRRPTVSVEQMRETSNREPVDCENGPAEALEQKEQRGRVRQAIAKLPEEFRQVLVLREMDGYDYEKIAQILDLPIGTVRSRLHRARVQLKEEFERGV